MFDVVDCLHLKKTRRFAQLLSSSSSEGWTLRGGPRSADHASRAWPASAAGPALKAARPRLRGARRREQRRRGDALREGRLVQGAREIQDVAQARGVPRELQHVALELSNSNLDAQHLAGR